MECLGFQDDDGEPADLGDGRGPQNATIVMREDFGAPLLGTCLETFEGLLHVLLHTWSKY